MNKYQFKFNEKTCEYRLVESRSLGQKLDKLNLFGHQLNSKDLIFKEGDCEDATVKKQNNKRYPIITDAEPSQETCDLLKNFLFCERGILTAHLSYLYQNWIWAVKDQSFADYLKILADNNEEILNAVGNIVVAFGGDPNFVVSSDQDWRSRYMLTSNDRNQFINDAIQMEQTSAIELESIIAKVENQSLKTLLGSIKEDKINVTKELANFMQ